MLYRPTSHTGGKTPTPLCCLFERGISPHAGEFLRERGVTFVMDVTRGDMSNWSIGEVVCNTAEQLGAAAVVMAPHGKGRLKECFMGSVCTHCLHHCKVWRRRLTPGRPREPGFTALEAII